MATKRKTRLLEPYGYREQDFFVGDISSKACQAEIEEINKVNSAQTSAITEIEDVNSAQTYAIEDLYALISGGAHIGATLWESGTPYGSDVRAVVTDQTTVSVPKKSTVQIHNDGTFWLLIEDDMVCLNEILKGLTHEEYDIY